MQSISEWLHPLGLDQYIQVFADNDVDLEALCLLTDAELEKLGVSLGHRKKLLKAMAELNDPTAAAPATKLQTSAPSPLATAQRLPTDTGERRQLTVLFCDMVGFTELANRGDPEVLQRIIRSYEDACAVCITRYEGYVFQRLGDGIVAFFGYPLAHEAKPSAPSMRDSPSSRPCPSSMSPTPAISRCASASPPGWWWCLRLRKARWARP